MEIIKNKWYKNEDLLPEQTSLPQDDHGLVGWFVIVEKNGDMYCANRWRKNSYWYWDIDDDYFTNYIERHGITHWMLVEPPKD